MILTNELNLVYDADGCNGDIANTISEVYRLLGFCLRVHKTSLEDWNPETNNGFTAVLHIASLDTEEFHSKIKLSFLKQAFTSFLVLVHSEESKIYMKRLEAGVKIVLKKIYTTDEERKNKVREMLSNVVFVSDIDQTLLWWPNVLKFVQSLKSKPAPRDLVRREIGIFFKINSEDGKQYEWYEKQKHIFESLFMVPCRASDIKHDENKYIAASKVVVMYIDRSEYQSNDPVQQKQRKLEMFNTVSQVQNTCALLKTKFHLIVNEAGLSFTKQLKKQGLKDMGAGIFRNWVELLHLLGKLHIKKQPEEIVYYSSHDTNDREVFSLDNYPGLQPIEFPMTPATGLRREASIGDILIQDKRYSKYVCYQPTTIDDVTSDDDHVVQPSCTSWLRCVCKQ
ncbi:hypothetical protein ACF0H5_008053 [Mactra antiquata]